MHANLAILRLPLGPFPLSSVTMTWLPGGGGATKSWFNQPPPSNHWLDYSIHYNNTLCAVRNSMSPQFNNGFSFSYDLIN